MENLIYQSISGLTTGMVYFLIAAGLTLILGTLKVVNFAQGSIYMLGAYTTYSLMKAFGHTNAGFGVTLAIAPIAVALFFCLLEIILLRHFYEKAALYVLLLTYGVLVSMYDVARLVWGLMILTAPMPPMFARALEFRSFLFPLYNIFLIVMGLSIAFLIWILIHKTSCGKTIRAASDDREMTEVLGINVPLVFTLVFGFGAWISAIGGAL